MMLPEGPEAKLAAKLLARPCPASLKSLFEAELGWQRVRRQAERVAVYLRHFFDKARHGFNPESS